MGYSESQWRSIQVRSVDPYASYYSDIVNKHTRVVSLGNDCIITGLNVTLVDPSNINVETGICVKDDVMLQFVSDVAIDLNDTSFYVNPATGGLTETGIYYVVVSYKYEKTRPAPYGKILVCKGFNEYDPTQHLFIAALQVDSFGGGVYGVINILDHDPLHPEISVTIPSLILEYRGRPCYLASLDCDGHIPASELWIDDTQISTRILWSSQKISDELEALREEATLSALTAEYDAYQDWCIDSRYTALTCDTFTNTDLINLGNTNAEIDTENRRIVGLAGHIFETLNLYSSDSGVTDLTRVALACEYSGTVNFYVTRDGGVNWESISLNTYGVSDNFPFASPAGSDLRIRAEFVTDGAIYSYGILYGEDIDWTNVDVADAANTVTWSLPATTLVAGSDAEFGRFEIPIDRNLYIKRTSIYRVDDGPENSDLVLNIENVSDSSILVSSSEKWDETLYIIPGGKIVSMKVLNTSPSNFDVTSFVVGVVGS